MYCLYCYYYVNWEFYNNKPKCIKCKNLMYFFCNRCAKEKEKCICEEQVEVKVFCNKCVNMENYLGDSYYKNSWYNWNLEEYNFWLKEEKDEKLFI